MINQKHITEDVTLKAEIFPSPFSLDRSTIEFFLLVEEEPNPIRGGDMFNYISYADLIKFNLELRKDLPTTPNWE